MLTSNETAFGLEQERKYTAVSQLKEMFDETQHFTAEAGRVIPGSAFDTFCLINDWCREELNKISPKLDVDFLQPYNYQTKETRDKYHWVNISGRRDAINFRKSQLITDRMQLLEMAAHEIMSLSAGQTAVSFEPSPYIRVAPVETSQCSVASFLMPLNAIGKSDFMIADVIDAAKKSFGLKIYDLPDNALLKLYSAPSLGSISRSRSKAFPFVGFTLDDLEGWTAKIRDRVPNAEVRTVLSVLSESEWAAQGTIHRIVPQSIDVNESIAHDPALYGGPDRKFNTTNLLKRWYQAQGHGYFIITEPEAN